MSLIPKKFQVIFLIDADLASCEKCNHRSDVILIVTRLLSAIRNDSKLKLVSLGINKLKTNDNDSPNDIQFKWGFKIFNSTVSLPRDKCKYDNASFKNLHQEQINRFESSLQSLFECNGQSAEKRKSLSNSSQLYATALTEVLHDFSWDNENIFSSPVHQKCTKNSLDEEQSWSNVVFILSRAPKTDKCLRQFSSKKVVDADVFIDSFMSPALLSEYQTNHRISVNWIDLSSFSDKSTCKGNLEDGTKDGCINLLRETCTKLGGTFLQKESIVNICPVADSKEDDAGSTKIPLFATDMVPAEAVILNILSGSRESHSSPQESPAHVCISASWFGINDVPVKLLPVSRNEVACRNQQASRITSRELCGASLNVVGLIDSNAVSGSLMRNILPAYMLTNLNESTPISKLLQILESTDTLALLSLSLSSSVHKPSAVLRHQAGCFYLSMIDKELLGFDVSSEETQKKRESMAVVPGKDKEMYRNSSMNNLCSSMTTLKQHVASSSKKELVLQPWQVFRNHCLNSWHAPGSTHQISGLVTQLQDRVNRRNCSPKKERNGLKTLKKYYAQERQPKELIQPSQTVISTPICAVRKPEQGSGSGASNGTTKSSTRGLKRRSSSFLTRGRLMADCARNASLVSEDTDDSMHSKSITSAPVEIVSPRLASFGDLDLSNEENLEKYVRLQYEQAVAIGACTDTAAKTMVTVTSQFMTSRDLNNPQREAATFIQSKFLLSATDLKDKHKAESSVDLSSRRDFECKLQVILILETESMFLDSDSERKESLTDQLVSILRMLSFSIGTSELRHFLTGIVSSYSATVPRLLVDIYDELMLTLPPALARFASPTTPGSVRHPNSVDLDASLSSAPGSSQASSVLSAESGLSKRPNRFKQHPSLADFRQKRQILVKAMSKAKPKSEAKKPVRERSRTRTLPVVPKRMGDECEKAKRNLFSDLKPKVTTPRLKEKHHSRAHKRRRHTTHAQDRLTLVMGTPAHKQRSGLHIQQQEKRRSRQNLMPDVQVVAESPVKDDEPEQDPAKMNKPAEYIVRQSFYSSKSQQSRNFTKALELSQKSDGLTVPEPSYEKYPSTSRRSHGTLASAVRGESPMVSPRSRLMRSFMTSPSPTSKSKRKSDASPLKAPGRPSRRLAKKLDFSNFDENSLQQPTQQDNIHLIFDGENAVGFDSLKSPSKNCSLNIVRKGLETPDKQKTTSFPDPWDMISPTKNSEKPSSSLTLRDALSNDLKVSPSFAQMKSPNTKKSPKNKMRQSPFKQITDSHTFTSPGQASRLRSNLFSKSPKKVNAFTESLDRHSASNLFGISPRKKQAEQTGTTPTKRRSCETEMMKTDSAVTPKKFDSGFETVNKRSSIYLTPSKVKFSESCLISPPTGSGYPPSADKSTPGKSILKGSSPSRLRGIKIPRRVELLSAKEDKLITSPQFRDEFSETNLHHSSGRFEILDSYEDPLKEHTACADTNQSCKSAKVISQKYSSTSSRAEEIRHGSDLNSNDENEAARHKPATVQIRTPSPSAKKQSNPRIDSWARVKKCSPRQTSSSSSNSDQSPNLSARSGGQNKGELFSFLEKENESDDKIDHAEDSLTTDQVTKFAFRKRSLFSEEGFNQGTSPSKRLKKNVDMAVEATENGLSSGFSLSLNRANTDQFNIAASPELFDGDGDEWSAHYLEANIEAVGTSCAFSQNTSSTTSPWKKRVASHQHPALGKRITRQSSDLSGEGSLGFQIPTTVFTTMGQSDQVNKSLKMTRSFTQEMFAHYSENKLTLDCDTNIEKGHIKKMCPKNNLENEGCHEGPALNSQISPNYLPGGLTRKSSAMSTGSNGWSPSHKGTSSPLQSSSPGNKPQYSPALSSTGLRNLISSPFTSKQVADMEKQERDARRKTTRPKSRKHLDME